MSDTVLIGRITKAPEASVFQDLQKKNKKIPLAILINHEESVGIQENTPQVMMVEVQPMTTPTYIEFLEKQNLLRTYQIVGPGRSGEQSFDVSAELTLVVRSRGNELMKKPQSLGNVILAYRNIPEGAELTR